MENSKFKPDYFKVSYSIRTPSYYRPEDNGPGFQSEAESMAFHADCERIFRNGGWKIEHGYAVNGKSSLYLHPQQFLGTIHEEAGRCCSGTHCSGNVVLFSAEWQTDY